MPQSPAVQRIALPNAVELLLRRDVSAPVIVDYDLARLVFRAITDGNVEGRELRLIRRTPARADFFSVRRALIDRGTLTEDRSLPHSVLRTGFHARPDPEAIFCAIDPFCYVSHLSAMVYHGLSNRLPKLLFFTSPAPTQWRELANARMARDLGSEFNNFRAANLPSLVRHKVEKIQGLTLNLTQTSGFGGGFRIAQDGLLRVSTLGRTYLDMLRRPDLCGGMAHVIEIFEQSANEHLSLIIGEVDKHGSKIDRVRAGYILEDRCGLRDDRIDAWAADAQRGGSRRLDPEREYVPSFSERWMISINV
jgi:predicted transcriptional regulator of viral defense system